MHSCSVEALLNKCASSRRATNSSHRSYDEWQAINGGKQPYAIAMNNGVPFGLAGPLGESASEDRVRTFTIITVPSNELIARIHDRMPAILRPAEYRANVTGLGARKPRAEELALPMSAESGDLGLNIKSSPP